ncbi:MAG: hypothetical protein ACREOM_11515 [Candidatus Dormibacteraceae bacterium]
MDGTDIPTYEEALRDFHASLASAGPTGFHSSRTYRIGGSYADWYLVQDSAALDHLNKAAVAQAALANHDRVADMSADGAGKLFTLLSGEAPAGAGFETRFSKPRGLSYRDLYAELRSWADLPDVSLWRRMMVLGPPPEFCLVSRSKLNLPAEMSPQTLLREPI